MNGYHVCDADLRAWAEDRLTEPGAWSVEAHLDGCATCRARVPASPGIPPPPVDLPVQGRVRRATRARRIRILIGTGPQARMAFVSAVAVTLALTLVVATQPGDRMPQWLLLLTAPALPVLGTAASYGRRTDPLHELVASSAYGGTRIVLWRTLSVLAVSLPVSVTGGIASGLGVPAVWLLPCVALTALTLALAAVTGTTAAAVTVGTGWGLLVTSTLWTPAGGAQLVTAGTTPVWLAVTVTAALMIPILGRMEAHR